MSDNQRELLEDVRQWLEWQKNCGADVWPVEDISIWQRRLSQPRRAIASSNESQRLNDRKIERKSNPMGFLKPKEKASKVQQPEKRKSNACFLLCNLTN